MPRISSSTVPLLYNIALVAALITTFPACRQPAHQSKDASTQDAPPQAPTKKPKDMNLEEARNAYAYYKSVDKDTQISNVIERIVILSTDQDEIEKLLREAGMIKIKQGLYEEAEVFFTNYLTLFPGSKIADGIESQLILSIHKQSKGSTRDLTKVHATIARAKAFLERFGTTNPHAVLVTTILEQSYLTLLEHEALQISFYLNKTKHVQKPEKAFISAQKRAETAHTKKLPPLNPSTEEQQILNESFQPLKDNFAQKPPAEQYTALQNYQSALITFIQKREALAHPTDQPSSIWGRFF